ncbi:MAG TPA: aminopeptidase P family protein [Bauldia sp.]|nr:aminopeptidase P family protein [Bauldia sp.]
MNEVSAKTTTATRLAALRAALSAAGLTGFLVPHADEHQSEYLPPSAERLAWLTGFTGSAGMAIVLMHEAAIFIDGRYTLQAEQQVDHASFQREHLVDAPPSKWLAAHARKGDRIGYDPWLMTVAEVRRFSEACAAADAELVAVESNPLDPLWTDRPAAPMAQVSLQPASLAGEDATAKIARLQAALAEKKVHAAVLTQADSVAWLLNIRGGDVAHNPVALAYAVLPAAGKPEVFIDGRKLSNSVRDAIAEIADPREPATLTVALANLGRQHARVLVDAQTTSEGVAAAVRNAGGTLVEGSDPVALPRARKNATEIEGIRRAHIRDGAAMVRFLAWFDREGASGRYDEIALADRLREFRAETAVRDSAELVDTSFDSISGAGPNGAIIHYRATPESSRKLVPGELYLIDSGAQYRDGTTDITRTVATGTPTAEMRDRFTRVLKGHIGIATARFPVGASGAQLDPFARRALWDAGLDYDHGTGHGVGAFLSVHEGPARISKLGTTPLESGMLMSNEPGYYKPGAYGIRIENLVLVQPADRMSGAERPMLMFETISFAPIDTRLVDAGLLTADERAWLNAYHDGLAARLGHLLGDHDRDWLGNATRPV